jgi:hypothetical protein
MDLRGRLNYQACPLARYGFFLYCFYSTNYGISIN